MIEKLIEMANQLNIIQTDLDKGNISAAKKRVDFLIEIVNQEIRNLESETGKE